MNRAFKSIFITTLLTLSLTAREIPRVDINISGKVAGPDGGALSGATVTLEKAGLSTQSNNKGDFSLILNNFAGLSPNVFPPSKGLKASLNNGNLLIQVANPLSVTLSTYSQLGTVLSRMQRFLNPGAYQFPVASPKSGVYFHKVVSENNEIVLKSVSLASHNPGQGRSGYSSDPTSALAKKAIVSAAFSDILKVTKSGYQTFSMDIHNAQKSGITVKLQYNQPTGGMLPQEGNPVHAMFNRYKEFTNRADNILSYQLDNGGWYKNKNYKGKGKGGSGTGTFDNGATTMELTVMADAYKRTKNSKYLDAARKAMEYTLDAQYPEGGWPQFYPLIGGYKDHVTFNDDAMSRVLTVLQHALDRTPPFDTDVFTAEQRSGLQQAIHKGVDYILKAQIIQNGKKTVWCAQHGQSDYKPKRARAYEHPSLSGMESVGIIGFLMTQPQTPQIKASVMAALDWYKSPDTYLDGDDPSGKKVVGKDSRVWWRFYDIPSNKPIFSNYDGKIWVGIENLGKKKGGYRWWGTWGEEIIDYAEKAGY